MRPCQRREVVVGEVAAAAVLVGGTLLLRYNAIAEGWVAPLGVGHLMAPAAAVRMALGWTGRQGMKIAMLLQTLLQQPFLHNRFLAWAEPAYTAALQ